MTPTSPRPHDLIRHPRTVSLALLAGLAAPAALQAAATDWPHWRGPNGNAVASDGANPPTEWSASDNVKWKVEVPGRGSSSPVIWGDRLFITTAVQSGEPEAAPEEADAPQEGRRRGRGPGGGGFGGRRPAPVEHEFVVLCYDKNSGDLLWQKSANKITPHSGHHQDHGYASASACTDGERVYAHFGSRGLFAFTMDGEPVWSRTDLGEMETRGGFGDGSSPTLHDGKLIVPWDHEGPSYIAALDAKTGETIWKTERDEPSSWGTPLIVEHGGKTQVIQTGQNYARGYDLESGEELWRCAGQTSRPCASPVAANGIAVIGSGHRGSFLGAFKLGASGDLGGTEAVAWSVDTATPDVPSPLLVGDRVYFHAGRDGILSCHDLESGEAHYSRERVDGIRQVYASPVAGGGHVYLTGRDGTTVVIKDGTALDIVSTNRLDEPVDATPAIVGDEIFIRGANHLYCISD